MLTVAPTADISAAGACSGVLSDPARAELQIALEQAVADVTQLSKKILRTGTVASTDNRNWELCRTVAPSAASRSHARSRSTSRVRRSRRTPFVFRFRVPYGTLLCMSEERLHGQIKLPGMADRFYRDRVDQHLRIGMCALELLREGKIEAQAESGAAS